jgi:hypothetical protein
MAIDIRATVSCSLGTLISGSINDDYLQGSGLVKTRGSVELSGLVTPAIGTAVEFSYSRNGITTYLPRKLRVLSSFADPYRRTTRVELGCKLTYLADLREQINWKALDDPENSGVTEADTEIITVPIRASSAMALCLSKLGITASSNPLTNKFSIAEFDYGAGYVQVLSDLLVSESYVGYLNRQEVLQILPLDEDGGTGPVVSQGKIIDLGSIGAGQLPGEAVTVSYSTLRSKFGDGTDLQTTAGESPFERSVTSSVSEIVIAYGLSSGGQATATYPILQASETVTRYRKIKTPNDDEVRVVDSRITVETTSAAAVLGGLVSSYLSEGIGFANNNVQARTLETFDYDAYGNETVRTVERRGSMAHAIGQVGLPMAFESGVVSVSYSGNYLLDKQVIETSRLRNTVQTVTKSYGPWIKSISGQQSIAESRDSFTTPAQVQAFINRAIRGECLLNVTVDCTDSNFQGQRGPTLSLLSAAPVGEAPIEFGAYNPSRSDPSDGSGDPNNGYRTEVKAGLELAVGSASAQRRIELSLPYAPDDVFVKNAPSGVPGAGSTFRTIKSDAAEKARQFGRVQNKLLMGNRSGVSLQCAAGTLPNQPFGPFIVQANGLSALYRCNGSGWTFDANGIIHSTDALFWGAIGGTGTFWFPVAPGITTLPTAPTVVDTTPTAMIGSVATVGSTAQATLSAAFPSATTGQGALDQATGNVYSLDASGTWVNVGPNPGPTMAAPAVVPVWNETLELSAKIRLGATVTSLAYALSLPTITLSPKVRVRATVRAVVTVALPTTSLDLAATAPAVSVNMPLPVTTLEMSTLAPVVEQAGVNVPLPVAELELSGVAPVIDSPGSVILPTASLELSGVAPVVAQIGGDPSWANVPLLLSMNGTNGSTTFTDSSTSARTVTAVGNAQISTAQSQWGGASALFDGNGDRLSVTGVALGTTFTLQCWVRIASVKDFHAIFDSRTSDNDTAGFVWGIRNTNQLFLYLNGFRIQSGTIVVDTWTHVALTCEAGAWKLWQGQTQVGSTYTNAVNQTRAAWRIGMDWNNLYGFNGYMDDFRVTSSVARTITIPTAQFPAG